MDAKEYGVNNQQGYATSIPLKVPAANAAVQSRVIDQDGITSSEEDVDDGGAGEEVEKINGVRVIGKDNCDVDGEDDVSDEEEEGDVDKDNDGYGGVVGERRNGKMGDIVIARPQKKRKLENLVSKYEFAPRVRAAPAHVAVQSTPSSAGRDIGANWSERETFALLDAWGVRFLKSGRKSLSSEEWQEVADAVLQDTNVERTVSQCRGRLDTLKKKYKKEKTGSATSEDVSKWVFFRKMDMLLCSPSQLPGSLSCGIDSGEYVFTNPEVYLNRANGLDEMRDSPDNSESTRDDEEGKRKKGRRVDESSFQMLADSIQKFSKMYEEIESDRRKQMVDLENMRMDFQSQIETQMRQILEKAQAEIVKIREDVDDENENENDLSAEDRSI